MSRFQTILFIGLLIGLGPVTIDTYGPLMPFVADSVGITLASAQLGISAMIIAMGFGQIIAGPFSDRFGRAIIIYIGMVFFLAGTVLAIVATSLEILLVGRFLQGLGAACGQIVGRAIMRDLHTGRDLARMASDTTAVMAFTVLVSPTISFYIGQAFGWQTTFVIIALYATVLTTFMNRRYKETLVEPDLDALNLRVMSKSFMTIFKNRQSSCFIIVLILTGIAMLTYVISAPLVYANSFGITGGLFALLFSLTGAGVMIGQITNRYLINAYGTIQTMVLTLSITVTVLGFGLLLDHFELLNGYSYCAVIFTFGTTLMMAVSNGQSLIMDPHGKIAGFAASLVGTLSMIAGSTSGTLISLIGNGRVFETLLCMFVSTSAALLLTYLYLWHVKKRTLDLANQTA